MNYSCFVWVHSLSLCTRSYSLSPNKRHHANSFCSQGLLPTFHSPLSHSHKPTRVLIFLLSSIKWTKNLWPTFPSTYCPISLQLNSLIVICRFPLIFPFTLCIEPTLVKFLPVLLHQNCSCQGHQVTSYRSFQWSIISPHLSWQAAFCGIDHSLLFDVLSFGLQNTTVS